MKCFGTRAKLKRTRTGKAICKTNIIAPERVNLKCGFIASIIDFCDKERRTKLIIRNERKQIKLLEITDKRLQPNVDERTNRDGSNTHIQRSKHYRRRRRGVFVLRFVVNKSILIVDIKQQKNEYKSKHTS